MKNKDLIDVDWYRHDHIPESIKREIYQQGFVVKTGLTFVEFYWNKDEYWDKKIEMKFYHMGRTADELVQFYHDLAAKDGINLNEVVKSLMKECEED